MSEREPVSAESEMLDPQMKLVLKTIQDLEKCMDEDIRKIGVLREQALGIKKIQDLLVQPSLSKEEIQTLLDFMYRPSF